MMVNRQFFFASSTLGRVIYCVTKAIFQDCISSLKSTFVLACRPPRFNHPCPFSSPSRRHNNSPASRISLHLVAFQAFEHICFVTLKQFLSRHTKPFCQAVKSLKVIL